MYLLAILSYGCGREDQGINAFVATPTTHSIFIKYNKAVANVTLQFRSEQANFKLLLSCLQDFHAENPAAEGN
jgi:hypothetical protein